jgi:hypothetical protein
VKPQRIELESIKLAPDDGGTIAIVAFRLLFGSAGPSVRVSLPIAADAAQPLSTLLDRALAGALDVLAGISALDRKEAAELLQEALRHPAALDYVPWLNPSNEPRS